MGLGVFFQVRVSSELEFAQALRPLSVFGLIHGSHEWFEMYLLLHPEATAAPGSTWLALLRVAILAVSFTCLVYVGARLICRPSNKRVEDSIVSILIMIWLTGLALIFLNLEKETSSL